MDLRWFAMLISILGSVQPSCRDHNSLCRVWASKNYCTNPSFAPYMKTDCMKSCNLCLNECRDNSPLCGSWKDMGECENNPQVMSNNCRRSCGHCTPPHLLNIIPQQPIGVQPTDYPQGGYVEITNQAPFQFSKLQCGQRTREAQREALSYYKIIGGQSKGEGRWPWQVGLYRSVYQRHPYCGGTLIKPNVVLTAAHCAPTLQTVVRIGDYDLRYTESNEQTIPVVKVVIHEHFERYTHRNDIALVILSRSVQLGANVNIICLPTKYMSASEGDQCHITGWGRQGAYNFASSTLKEAIVPLVNRYICNLRYRGRITERMLCAGYPHGGVDACKGDSGGSLVCQRDGKFFVYGVTSWGYGCGKSWTPGVYTDVSKYLEWIEANSNNFEHAHTAFPSRPNNRFILYPLFYSYFRKATNLTRSGCV